MNPLYIEVHPSAEQESTVLSGQIGNGRLCKFLANYYISGPRDTEDGPFMFTLIGGNNPGGREEFGGSEQVIPLSRYYITVVEEIPA